MLNYSVQKLYRSSESSPVDGACGAPCSLVDCVHVQRCLLYMQISYASSAEVLSDRQQFHSFFRTESSEKILPPGFASFVKHFGWKQIGIISQQENHFLNVSRIHDIK